MEIVTAQKFPLFREYDFGIHLVGSGGTGIILIPKNNIYTAKSYGFGELSLVHYLQDVFNDGRDIEAGDLIAELEEEGEISLVPDPILDRDFFTNKREHSFLERVLRKFSKHKITKVEKKAGTAEFLDQKDLISKGENYDTARVYRMGEHGRQDNISFPISSVY